MENSFCVETLRGGCGFPTRSEDVKSDKNIRLARLQTRWVARKLGKGIDDDDDDDLSLSLEDDRFDENENWEGVGRIFVSSWPLSLSLFFSSSLETRRNWVVVTCVCRFLERNCFLDLGWSEG